MTQSEARFILSAFRPNGADAVDPSFAEALAQASSDPELRAWFEHSRAHDARIASRLAEIAPPPGLREAILAGARVSRPPPPSSRISRFWPVWLTVAAAAGLAIAVWLRGPLLARGPSPMVFAAFADYDMTHGHHGGSGAATGEWAARLASSQTPLSEAAGADFDRLQQSGCRTLHFAGRDLLEVCFVREGVQYHLYVMRGVQPARGSAGAEGARPPGFFAEPGGAVAVWSVGSVRYAVASRAGLASVRSLF